MINERYLYLFISSVCRAMASGRMSVEISCYRKDFITTTTMHFTQEAKARGKERKREEGEKEREEREKER